MKGNTFFNKLVSPTDWHNDVESRVGTNTARNKNVKEAEQLKEVKQLISIYENYINLKEPRSNRGIEEFKGKDELEAEKKAAKAKAQQKAKDAAAASQKKTGATPGEEPAAAE